MTVPATRWTAPTLPKETAAALRVVEGNLTRLEGALPEVPKRFRYRLTTAATTLGDGDDVLLADTTGGSFAVTLPDATTYAGRRFEVKKMVAANTMTLTAAGSDTIDGAATVAVTTQYASYSLVSVRTALPATYAWVIV